MNATSVACACIVQQVPSCQDIVRVDQAIPRVPIDRVAIASRVATECGACNVALASLTIYCTANLTSRVAVENTVCDVAEVCVHEQCSGIRIRCVIVKVAGVNVACGVSKIQASSLLSLVEGKLIQAELHGGVRQLISS